jgi:hypothetical protein
VYTALIAFGGCVVLIARAWAPRVVPAVIAVAILGGGVRTFVRNADWRDEIEHVG